MTDLVTWLTDRQTLDPKLSGGKGAALARMAQAGLAVPDAFVVTSHAFVRATRGRLDEATARIRDAADDLEAIEEAASFAADAIHGPDMPDDLLAAVRGALDTLGARAVAVRKGRRRCGDDAGAETTPVRRPWLLARCGVGSHASAEAGVARMVYVARMAYVARMVNASHASAEAARHDPCVCFMSLYCVRSWFCVRSGLFEKIEKSDPDNLRRFRA